LEQRCRREKKNLFWRGFSWGFPEEQLKEFFFSKERLSRFESASRRFESK